MNCVRRREGRENSVSYSTSRKIVKDNQVFVELIQNVDVLEISHVSR